MPRRTRPSRSLTGASTIRGPASSPKRAPVRSLLFSLSSYVGRPVSALPRRRRMPCRSGWRLFGHSRCRLLRAPCGLSLVAARAPGARHCASHHEKDRGEPHAVTRKRRGNVSHPSTTAPRFVCAMYLFDRRTWPHGSIPSRLAGDSFPCPPPNMQRQPSHPRTRQSDHQGLEERRRAR
jgi:hypothetical protein